MVITWHFVFVLRVQGSNPLFILDPLPLDNVTPAPAFKHWHLATLLSLKIIVVTTLDTFCDMVIRAATWNNNFWSQKCLNFILMHLGLDHTLAQKLDSHWTHSVTESGMELLKLSHIFYWHCEMGLAWPVEHNLAILVLCYIANNW